MKYQDKIVWITGASSGIGKALAKAYYNDGAKLILSSRREEALEAVKKEINPNADDIKILALDLSKSDLFDDLVQHAIALFGKIDVLVNNGGISQRSLLINTQPSTLRALMEVNFFGTTLLTKAILPYLIKQKEGHIVVVSSVTGKFGTKLRTGYAASKHALQGFFDSLRHELYAHNIDVTVICPGFIKTNISLNALKGDGSTYGIMGDNHADAMAPDEMVRKIWNKLYKRKDEIIVSAFKERFAVTLKRISPTLLNKILKKSKVV